ncbi:hypothetical protein FYK55_13440 [Roseiconus nitratireducens]|uniref:PSP1 C-terminal domain-containing protein n=1 Tax=Roseiconus nitratireducens TaxID=2605748 RepID=A0A5M6D8A7_9BACT|nr:hypothetical protein [Roseiconus nitratireducens]KAA5542542.1 hypothetical protein FYK55_13440 [Roseiconus nitratireducens]
MKHYFLRIGSLGEIRLGSALAPLERGRRVVVRSPRGVEIAEVASECRRTGPSLSPPGGDALGPRYRILRPTTVSDELLVRRLERYKRDAIESCRRRLQEANCGATLLDVDQLFDGGTLVLHFVGHLDPVAQEIADRVAAEYESIVRTNHLAELISAGCGPACGTDQSGCGTGEGACAGCSGC